MSNKSPTAFFTMLIPVVHKELFDRNLYRFTNPLWVNALSREPNLHVFGNSEKGSHDQMEDWTSFKDQLLRSTLKLVPGGAEG